MGGCAWGADLMGKVTGSDVAFTEAGLTDPSSCGCLAGLLLHEVAHLIGIPEGDNPDPAAVLAKKCIPRAQNQ